jgi:hypothetical protein
MSDNALSHGDSSTIYIPTSRVSPLPTAPWGSLASAYRAAKALALDATDRFVSEKKPGFGVVNVMPGYVLGRNELILDEAEDLVSGSNAIPLSIVKGVKSPTTRPGTVTDVRDVARVHVGSLDEELVRVGAGEARSFLLDTGNVKFDDVNGIVEKAFPEAAQKGLVSLGGEIPAVWQNVDVRGTTEVFGDLRGFEEMVKSVVGQYLELKEKAK